MTEVIEGVAVVKESMDPPPEKKPLKIRCIMLFDGTGNNKTNIESRISQNEFYQATRSRKYKLFGERVGPGDDSYENGFTNIVTLDKHIRDIRYEGYDLVLKVYTEGAGTEDNESDRKIGYAVGLGRTGVITKCERGITKTVNKILNGQINGEDIDPSLYYIELLTIDVFGFSRGAATARYCIHKVLHDETWKMKVQLAAFGLQALKVEVNFAGLFDTVSSHGRSFKDDTAKLKLDSVVYALKVVHLVAAEEYRENFSITNINSAIEEGNGEEHFMPGVHSDVGGSYLEDESEHFVLNRGLPAAIEQDKKTLIEQGWYNDNDKEIIKIQFNDEAGMAYAMIRANRTGISNAYCNIPLKQMALRAAKQGIVFAAELEFEANKAIAGGGSDLQQLDASIAKYMTPNIETFEALIYDPLLKLVRHKHLHMSSKMELGLHPRFRNDPVKGQIRWRQSHAG